METKTTDKRWSENYERMFSASKGMFTINPLTGKAEMKSGKGNWRNLVNVMVRAARVIDVRKTERETFNSENATSGLKQIVTWPGGKKNELKYIYPNLPSYDRYFEPFVGGGSVYMGINANEYYINDFSTDLISLYRYIATNDLDFFRHATIIDKSWKKAKDFSNNVVNSLFDIYHQFKGDDLTFDEVKNIVSNFCQDKSEEILELISEYQHLPTILLSEMEKNICRKMRYLKKENVSGFVDFQKIMEASIKGALYNNYRNLYNNKYIEETNSALHSALFFFIRQTVRGGMFGYNKKGEFNMGYGGIGENKTNLLNKLEEYGSEAVKEHFRNTHIYNLDFEDFLRKTNPAENDFIFLDPPYDDTFSTYDANDFNRKDHQRLASYLLNDCKAKWMMIIKKTDFIYNLYKKAGIYFQTYGKTYICNMGKDGMRTETTHMLITNYTPKSETYRMAA